MGEEDEYVVERFASTPTVVLVVDPNLKHMAVQGAQPDIQSWQCYQARECWKLTECSVEAAVWLIN